MITNAKEARAAIGKMVEWEDPRWLKTRYMRGTLQEVSGKNLFISGDWYWRPQLLSLKIADKQNEPSTD